MSVTDDQIAVITRDQLRGASQELRALADKLDAFRGGDSDAWTAEDTLAGHSMLTIIQSHTGLTRTLRAAETRRRNVFQLDDRRRELGSPSAP